MLLTASYCQSIRDVHIVYSSVKNCAQDAHVLDRLTCPRPVDSVYQIPELPLVSLPELCVKESLSGIVVAGEVNAQLLLQTIVHPPPMKIGALVRF